MKKTICLIGNYSKGEEVFDGQRCKVRVYYDALVNEGFNVFLIDLKDVTRKPFRTFLQIKKGINLSDIIVLITAHRGIKLLLPFVNYVNRKYHKRFLLPLVGISVLHNTLDKLTENQVIDFVLNRNYSLKKPSKRLIKNLKKVDVIMPETDIICDIFRNYYGLNNICKLTNFRKDIFVSRKPKDNSVVFISRLTEEKGIMDLLSVFQNVIDWKLDIFGHMDLSDKNKEQFDYIVSNSQNIKYFGEIKPDEVINKLSEYQLLVFPTRYIGEGTPGVISESFMAGTPVLSSSFLMSQELLNNGVDSLVFQMFDLEDFKSKLLFLLNNKKILISMSDKAKESGLKFQYSFNRKRFLQIINGLETLQ